MGISSVLFIFSLLTVVHAQVKFKNVNDSSVFEVKEDVPVGYTIVVLEINNPNNVSYKFTFNGGGGPFVLTPDNKIQLSNKLDYETITSYFVTIIIKSDQSMDSASINITVVDVVNEDNLPNITVYNGDVKLAEQSSIGAIVPFNYTVENLAGRIVTYILLGPASIFTINPQNGIIKLNTTIDADQPTTDLVYTTVLLVNTSDARSSSVTFTLTILDINDNPPVCDQMVQYSHVTENIPAPLDVYTLNCNDKDRDAVNRNISYSIIHGNTSLFSVNGSGTISTIDVIDYEQLQREILWIKVSDGGSDITLSTKVTVYVYVTPVNDNRPSFSAWQPAIPADRTYTLSENSSTGTSLFTVRATDDDRDIGGDITYSIFATNASANIQDVFIIDQKYGIVSLFGKIDADAGTTLYNITAQASDGTYNVTQDVSIQITDVNDNVPKFVGLPHNVTWPEQSCVANFVIVNMTASDADISSGNLTMEVNEIIFGSGNINDWEVLSSSPTTAQLRLKRSIDLDKGDTNTFLLKITVRDGGSPELTGVATLILYILPDNEFTPEIISSPDNLMIPENDTIGTEVGTLTARDNDTGAEGRLVYSITDGNIDNIFKIDSGGKLMVIGKLDTEVHNKYNLTIEVRDSGIDQKMTTAVIHITVTDVNEFMPDCLFLIIAISLPENSSLNTSVYLFNCTDRDGDLLTYTVQKPENETFIYSNDINGLQLINSVDYDSPVQQYMVKIDVSDGIFTTVVNIRIQLTHVNEYQPKFLSNETLNITENTRPTNPLLRYTANDSDYSPDNIVKYTLTSDIDISSLFSIDPIAGEISLLKDLDYDILPDNHKFYILQVIADDGGGLQGTGTVIINVLNVNDNAPRCSHVVFTTNINETQNGNGPYILIPSLECKDVEDGTNLNYTLSQTPGSHFTLQNQTLLLIANTLDYETASSHILNVTVSDNGTPSLNITVIIYITVLNMNDGPPGFSAISPVHVLETANIGYVIIVVNATDPDGSDAVFGDPQYTIISGDPTNHFTIGLDSGEIALKRMLDYETEKSYTLIIQAKERGGFYSSTTNVTIFVDDVNDELPFCDPNFIFSSVAENETASFVIATLNCSDKDAGTNLTFNVDDANNTRFQMTGVNLSLKSSLDFETETFHEFRINVSDGIHIIQIDVIINVRSIDEYPPVFEKDHYLVNLSEDVKISTVALTVHANDSDSPLDSNGIVKYSLTASSEFIIDSETGKIIITKYLDREKTSNYTLIVFAHDAFYVANATIEVTVTDVNDNPPVFTSSSYSGRINETSPANTSIITVTATDNDDPLTNGNGIVQYAIVNDSSYFTINKSTGEILNTRDFDTDVTGVTVFTLIVSATDRFGQSGALSATAVVSILITTVNQHQPVFTSDKYNIIVKENQYSYGDVILSVTASDNDTGIDGEFTFSLIPPQTKFSLTKNGSLGEIRLIESLDFDKQDQLFQFVIVVTDKGVPPKSSTTTVNIIVDDENDNPPVCTSVFYVAKEEGVNDINIVNLHCSDADKSNNLSYSIASVFPNKTSFQVSSLGLVNVSGILDYEISNFYEILILVQDDRQPVHNTTVKINLKVIDVNDKDPLFTGPFTFSVNESDTVSNKVLYQANASGNDGPTDVVTYSLKDRTYFDISPTSGEISIKTTAPDYEVFRDYYNLTVCATDTPNPVSRTVCQNITVTLIDVDDNLPIFSPSIYSASVKEDVLQGVIISTITARDADISSAYHTILYTIIDGNTEGKFSIYNNGSVIINASLDFETTTYYSLTIKASDSLHSANTSLNILVLPVNEYSPQFPVTNLTFSLPENSPFDSNFTLNISATDGDHGLDGKIFYRIEPGPFSIDPDTGVIRVISNLDRETKQNYILLVQAIDRGIPSKTGTLTLTVEVTDENDNIPECTSVVYTALVSEGTKTQSQLISKLMCHDDDQDPANLNNKITYAIVSGETTKFEINQLGELMLKSNVTLDFETDPKYQIVVKVMDSGLQVQHSSTVTVDILIKDENDNPPVFTSLHTVTVSEDVTVGSKLETVKATDKDTGDNGFIMFTITKGNNDTHFTIDPWNGDIYLTSQLDFETQKIFELEITARDLGFIPLSATGTMTISVTDVNDNVPNCNMMVYASSLQENSQNVDIAYLNCTDKDTVGSLSYSIVSVLGINSTFFIINQTGVISVIPAAQIDYESTQQFTLQIKISDGVHSVFSFVKVSVLDIDEFDPYFSPPGPYNVNVTEDVHLNTVVITVSATDEDRLDSFKYFSIVNGNNDNKFLMDPVTGSVKVLNSLDYEITKSYLLTLQVTDSGNRSTTALLSISVIDVNDNHPFCNSTWEVVTVNENDFNKTLFIPDCSDLDSNLDINNRYTLVSGNLSSIDFSRTTGAVYLISPLDYEVMTSHTVNIKAFDNGLPDVGVDITLTIIINPVNEYSPVFNPSSFYNESVSEDVPVGSHVLKVNATDQDKGSLQGTVRYSIISGDPYQYFEIDENSGEIKTVKSLDRETINSYNITIEAADDFPGSAASKNSTATCFIKINDVNDNTPIFNASLYIANLLETDDRHALVTVFATDKDDPFTKDYGKVTYQIVKGGSDFIIDPITGEINNSHVLDADITGKIFYTISVVATDSGGLSGALNSTTMVVIKLITVNEFKPEFSLPYYSITINETQFKFGDEILNFSAKDNDTGQDGEFIFEFALPQTKFALVQDGYKGKIILNEALDFENNDTVFHFQVIAKDKGSPSMTGIADVTIIVNDDNDNSPTCISVVNVDVPENTAHITNLTCNDLDSMTAFSYIVDSVMPSSINVSVNSNGVVTALPMLDYEKDMSYKIVIQVFDASFSSVKHTASVVINLRVRDLNDNQPSFAGPFNFSISEDEAVSSKILYKVNASSNDGPTDYLTFSLYPSTYFAVTPLSGEITLKSAAPDYETVGPEYIFTVCVTDTPNPISFTVCQNISVHITDVNDVSPIFTPAVYSTSVAESASVGTNLSVSVTATDGDISPNFKTVTYLIIDGNMAGNFKIDSRSGVVSLTQQLDYETITSYALIIQASDSKFTTNASYFIQVSPVNEFPPTFNVSVINYNISENTLTNVTFSLPFKVTDGDRGLDGQYTFSISEGPFEIDLSTGLLSVVSNIDREKNQFYTLLIKAIDKGSEPKTGTLTLSVNVLDENDNAPKCSQYFYTAMFAEEVELSMIVEALNCVDLDNDPLQKNNAINYTLVSNNTSMFEVTTNGVIKVKNNVKFDRETQDFYEIIVEVSDQALIGKLTTTVTVEITITDLNDNPPIFTSLSSKNLSEDLPLGSFVTQVQANDKDIGKNAELSYSIVGGNTENKFRIDTVTGTINLESYLDYEATKFYQLIITATDKGFPSLTGTVTLTVSVTDVNDNPPYCPSFFSSIFIMENTQNFSLGSVSCSDKDTVGSLNYSIISGNDENNFGIDINGYIFVQPIAHLDFEVKQNYLLQILVTDGVHNVTELMKVSLTDVDEFKPRFLPSGPYNTTVKENASVGSSVFLLNATDDDIYDLTRTYSIIDTNIRQKFTLDSNSIKILSPLDYELEQSYTFSIMVQDSTALNDTTTITVYVEDINDNSPSCNESSAIVSVDENVSNKILYTPKCTDADKVASPTLVFSIMPSSISALSVSSTTGALSLQNGLDYEQNSTIRVVMIVSDNGSPSLSTSINIWVNINPVNEYPPEFTQLSYGPYSIPENVSLGTQVAILSASDKDRGLLQGTVRYQIVAGDDQQYFTIDETTGALKVIRSLDREARSSYNLTVKASDDMPGSANQKTATAAVSILVTDVNDEKPVFTQGLYFLNVSESAKAGPTAELLKFEVQDGDIGINSQTMVAITSGNTENRFSINGKSLILTQNLDYETTDHYELILTVTDNGSPPLSSNCTVIIDVLPSNDNSPLMNVSSMVKTIPEDLPVGTLIFDADASDVDKGMQGRITYEIASGVPSDDFVIDSTNGKMYVGSILDFDAGPQNYSIIIRAVDGDSISPRTATASLSLILSDVNDNPPVFTPNSNVFSVNENSPVGINLGKLLVTDADSGVNGQIILSLTGGNGLPYFTINTEKQLVTTSNNIDYEINKVLYLTVKAVDGGLPSLTSHSLVKIDINNMNDNFPTITPANLTVHVMENATIGTVVQNYLTNDLDTLVDLVKLSSSDQYFDINSTTGVLTLKSPLDREKINSHTLEIIAVDRATAVDPAVHSTTASISVIVDDVNDNAPIITGTYSKSVPETIAVNEIVFVIVASDADVGVNSELVYRITAGNTDDSFKIDSVGNLLVAKPLDPDVVNHYTLTITVSDRGTPSLSSTVTVGIFVINVNDPPVFELSPYIFNIDENSPVGKTVGVVTARDKDQGADKQLFYSFVSFSLGSFSHFIINSSSGAILVASGNIDREKIPQYRGIVQVTDGGIPALTATSEVIININDLDDNGPVFNPVSYTKTVKENLPQGSSIVQLTTTDADTPANSGVLFNIITNMLDGSLAANVFQVNSVGLVTVKAILDYETYKNISFIIQASKPDLQLAVTASVLIILSDENDNIPTFKASFVNSELDYKKSCNDIVTQVSATDADSGDNARIIYSLDTSSYGGLFTVDSVTGDIKMNAEAEPSKKYTIVVRANDLGVPQLSSTATVRIDTFNPADTILSIDLSISKADFVLRQQTFITNLQNKLQQKYPQAVLKLWCLTERTGVASSPGSTSRRRKREDTSKPVTVQIYALQDNSTQSVSNLGQQKQFLSQGDLMTTFNDITSSTAGSQYSYFKIQSVKTYSSSESSTGWWDTVYGPIITAIVIALGLIFIAVLIVCCCRHHRKKKLSERNSSSDEPEIPPEDYSYRHFKGYQGVEFYPAYPKSYPVRLVHGNAEQFTNPYFTSKQHTHL